MSQIDPRFFDDEDYSEDPEELNSPYDPLYETEEEALESDHRDD
jgi:hypothetical protein